MKKRTGQIVKTKAGDMGIVYDDEKAINGKLRVHLVNAETLELTGKKILSQGKNLTIKGFTD